MWTKIKIYLAIVFVLSSCTGIVVSITKLYFSFKSNIEKVTTLSIQNEQLQKQILKQNQTLQILQRDIEQLNDIQNKLTVIRQQSEKGLQEFKQMLTEKKTLENTNLINEQYSKIENITKSKK